MRRKQRNHLPNSSMAPTNLGLGTHTPLSSVVHLLPLREPQSDAGNFEQFKTPFPKTAQE